MKVKIWLVAITLILCALALSACTVAVHSETEASAPRADAPRVENLAATEAVSFSVSRAFSSNMVIQRDEPIRVWGWAPTSRNGETVTATFLGKIATGKIEDGEWLITFSESFSANASLGNDMTIICGADKVVFEDVLVGDVYMVIGQSNVAYQVEAHCNNNKVSISSLVDADAPIRLKYNTLNDTAGYPARGTEEVCEDVVNGRAWWLPTVQNVRSFTAIGYLFAREIVEKTGGEIPVGIIEIDGNGQPLGAFMPNEAAAATGSDTLNGGIYVPPGVNGTHARYMYNHYMYPYEKYALAGLIWYQGESDFQTDTANTYAEKFTTLMEHMRDTHNLKNRDFPIYIVEFPTIYNRPDDFTGSAYHTMDLGYIRAEMGSLPGFLSNTYMAVSSDMFTDVYYYNGLHPDIKDLQAKRLADLAAAVQYGLMPLEEATGPILKSYEVSEDRKTVILTFDNVGDGLATSDGGKTVNGFVPLRKNGSLGQASAVTATITAADQITLTSTDSMYGVAYNCVMDNFYGKQINLCNSNGKIASAFTFSEERRYQIRREVVGEELQATALSAGETLAVHFRTPADMVAVGTPLMNLNGEVGTLTLTLYAFDTDYTTTLASKPILTSSFSDFSDHSYAELAYKRRQGIPAGEYLLVISEASQVSVQTAGAHEGQVLYRDGAYVADASLLLTITYEDKTETLYEIPSDPNTAPPETEPVTEPETQPMTEPDTDAPTQTETETSAADEAGCASAMGGGWILLLLLLSLLVLRVRAGGPADSCTPACARAWNEHTD